MSLTDLATEAQRAAAGEQRTYLVTGGAGFLGINIVRHLLARGHKVVSLDIADFAYPERSRITEIRGDIRDAATVIRAMEGIDIVIHTAAALPLYSPADIYSTDIDGVRIMLTVAQNFGVERFVHISSTAVYGIPDHHPLYETDRLDGVGPYGESKVLVESICEGFRKQGMCVPIIRPKSFVGPERLGVFALFYDWAKDGKNFPVLGSGNNRYQLLDVEDLCDAIYLTCTLPREQVNDTFNIGAKEFTTLQAKITRRCSTMPALASASSRFLLRRLSGRCGRWRRCICRRSTGGSTRP
jgi:nucleoside-diphosphate-sugar epimerase